MSCFLCGHEETHHLGCPRVGHPEINPKLAVALGLMAAPAGEAAHVDHVEVLKEGSMTTEPAPAPEGTTVGQCEFNNCDNPKYSDHPRVKFCEEHRDPKNRKE